MTREQVVDWSAMWDDTGTVQVRGTATLWSQVTHSVVVSAALSAGGPGYTEEAGSVRGADEKNNPRSKQIKFNN